MSPYGLRACSALMISCFPLPKSMRISINTQTTWRSPQGPGKFPHIGVAAATGNMKRISYGKESVAKHDFLV